MKENIRDALKVSVKDDTPKCAHHNRQYDTKQTISTRQNNLPLEDYFVNQCEKVGIRVVPGHWVDFNSMEEIDNWISEVNIFAIKQGYKK